MKTNRQLPHLSDKVFLTDGGLETTLIFHEGLDLPCFAAFDLLKSEEGRQTLHDYYLRYYKIAKERGTGFVLESPTWRANADWGEQLGYFLESLAEANSGAVEFLKAFRSRYEVEDSPMVISGCIGPRGDGYDPSKRMNVEEAQQYHLTQIETFRQSGADMVAAFTMNYVEEAIGITQAAQEIGIPVVISFTVETDGKLPTGTELGHAIDQVDEATDNGPAYYMINCAHPSHFASTLTGGASWLKRIHGLRANASCLSHAELDEAEELDDGNPQELASQYQALRHLLINANVFGGCCGTDHRHVEQIAEACT